MTKKKVVPDEGQIPPVTPAPEPIPEDLSEDDKVQEINANAQRIIDDIVANPNRVGPGHPSYEMLGQYWVRNGRPAQFTFNNVQRYMVIRDSAVVFIKIGGTLKESAQYGATSL